MMLLAATFPILCFLLASNPLRWEQQSRGMLFMKKGASFRVRLATVDDASSIAKLLRASVAASNGYNSLQTKAWLSVLPSTEQCRLRLAQDKRSTWVATIDDDETPPSHVIGMMDLESNGHLDFAYVHPDHVRCGVATALYRELERHANCPKLFTEASESAKDFFMNVGFHVIGKQDIVIGSIALWNYKMEKELLRV